MTVSEARRLKALEQENTKLKKLLAEAELDKAALRGSTGPTMVSPQAKREAVTVLMNERHLRFTRACGLVGISGSLYRHQSRWPDAGILRSRIGEIAAEADPGQRELVHGLRCRWARRWPSHPLSHPRR